MSFFTLSAPSLLCIFFTFSIFSREIFFFSFLGGILFNSRNRFFFYFRLLRLSAVPKEKTKKSFLETLNVSLVTLTFDVYDDDP